jgi:hypothetical protein
VFVLGHAIAEAVSCWLPTVGAPGSRPCLASGICGGQSGVGAGFLCVLWFPLQKTILFHQLLHHHNHPGQLAEALQWADHRPRSPADCPRSSNWNETESFMEVAKAQNWAVEPPKKSGGGWRSWEKYCLFYIM